MVTFHPGKQLTFTGQVLSLSYTQIGTAINKSTGSLIKSYREFNLAKVICSFSKATRAVISGRDTTWGRKISEKHLSSPTM